MPVPIIAAGISAIGGIVGAKMASGAATKAADQQVASTDKALGQVQGAYNTYFNPAFSTLSQLSGLPPVAPLGNVQAPLGGESSAIPSGSRPRNGQPITGWAVPRGQVPPGEPTAQDRASAGTLASMGAPQVQARAQTASGYGGGVRMRTPDGRTVMVPNNKVADAEARGGVVI
jgi:hypothetical protein